MLKLNLQHFAEAGTLVNTTGNYVDAYSGTSESFADKNTLTPTMKTYYDTELLENARAELVHTQFGKKQPMKGNKVEWRKFNTFAKALTPLQEGVIPTGQNFGMTNIEGEITQHGDFTAVSDRLE